MPTARIVGPYRFYFTSHDSGEPPHVHVERDDQNAKVWLAPVSIEWSRGFSAKECNRILDIVTEFRQEFTERWREFFDG